MTTQNTYRDETKPGTRHIYTSDSGYKPGAPHGCSPTPDLCFSFNGDRNDIIVLHVGPATLELIAQKAPQALERFRRDFPGQSKAAPPSAGFQELIDKILGDLPKGKKYGSAAGAVVDLNDAFPADTWAVVELMGHVRVAGRLSEVAFAGATLGMLHIPYKGEFRLMTFNPTSIYRMQLVNEEAARVVAALEEEHHGNWPVKPWEMPEAKKPTCATGKTVHEGAPLADALDEYDRVGEGETD